MPRSVLIALLLAAGPLAAQDTTVTVTLTLDEAVRVARQNNAAYRQAANDATPAAWGVRSAYTSLIPDLSLSGFMGYRGPGSQTFLTTTFQQSSATVSSSYGINLNLTVTPATLMQPALARAERDAVQANIDAAHSAMESQVTGQFLNVLQAEANLELQRRTLARAEESRRLAQGRFEVGQVTRIDTRQAEVAEGQARVELMRLEQLVRVEKLRLFRLMGVPPPTDVMAIRLVDEFEMIEPTWPVDSLRGIAAGRHPGLHALEEQEAAARWRARAQRTSYLPTLRLSAGWSGFTQQFTNVDPSIAIAVRGDSLSALNSVQSCQDQNVIRAGLTTPLPPEDCSALVFTPVRRTEIEETIREQNSVFPFAFTRQPFQAGLFVSFPIFNGFNRELQLSQAEAAANDAELAARDQALQLHAEVTSRAYDAERAFRTIAIQESNQLAARDQLELATERYRLGQGSFFELLEAQVTAQTAERDYVNARYEYQRAVVLLEEAVGTALR
jgi:outer membrane protein TolC